MDIALQHHFTPKQLVHINLCRLYLHVITLADVTNAKGDRLLPEVDCGQSIIQRTSSLLWPNIPRPPNSFWVTWQAFLCCLAHGSGLLQPLGKWTSKPNQEWLWYQDTADVLYEQKEEVSWATYYPEPGQRMTRQFAFTYRTALLSPYPPDMSRSFPTTVK